jgi:enoyl-CoA hydratase/carnithine racemase
VLFTLDRPHVRNALSSALVAELNSSLGGLDADGSVGAIVIVGEKPGFCSGSDLRELAGMSVDSMCVHEAATGALARKLRSFALPVIAAVEGFAIGGGFAFAASCDVVVTASAARWHLPEVALGWIPPWGIGPIVDRCGPVRGRQIVWGDRPIDGAEAFRLGIADHLVPDGAALGAALDLADRLAALPSDARTSTKRFFATLTGPSDERLDAVANDMFAADCVSPGARATFERFAQKVG